MSVITRLTTPIAERGTAKFSVAFTDETGAAVVPNSGLAWTLTDTLGTVVNSRSSVSITPASSVAIVLHGADLALDDALYFGTERVLTVQGTFNSSIGSNLELKNQCNFYITDLVAVS